MNIKEVKYMDDVDGSDTNKKDVKGQDTDESQKQKTQYDPRQWPEY